MKKKNMDGYGYFIQVTKKHMIFILVITICITVITALLNNFVIKPVYQANCSVIIGKENGQNISEGEAQMYQSLIKTYSEIGKSRKVAENASQKLNSRFAPEELMSNMKIVPQNGTQIIEISYESLKPTEASKIANAISEAFVQECKRLLPASQINVIDKALVPYKPIKPNKTINCLLAFLCGLMLSTSISFFIEYLDNKIKTEEDLEKYLDIPFIGIVPKCLKMKELIVRKEPKSFITEAYKKIRTNILFSLENKGLKTFLVTSANPKEGKTIVSTNTAYVIAQTGKKTLLIDCNLRNPFIHKYFSVINKDGIAEFINGTSRMEDVIIKIGDNLDIITAGLMTDNPAEVLATQKMKFFIKKMESQYDCIIIDTPPLLPVTDTLILASERIGIVLVVNTEAPNIDSCKKSKELLLKYNSIIIGAVLNEIQKKSFSGSRNEFKGKEKIKASQACVAKNS